MSRSRAAFFFARTLEEDATVLVGDFGGGTSDFSITRFHQENDEIRSQALANAGVGVAGDAFDYRIIDNVVSPHLGQGFILQGLRQCAADSQLGTSPPSRGGSIWPCCAPHATYAIFAASCGTRARPSSRAGLAALVEVLDHNHGYRLYQAVSTPEGGPVGRPGRRCRSCSRPGRCGSRRRFVGRNSKPGSRRNSTPWTGRSTRRWRGRT